MTSWFLRTAALATVGLLTLTACGSPDARFQRYGNPGHVAIGQAADGGPAVAFDAAATDQPGRLIGPHYSLLISGYSVTDVARDDTAAVYGFADGPVKADTDHELFAAYVDPSSVAPTVELDVVVVVGGEEIPLEHFPVGGETVAAVIPAGGDVVLAVTDEERTQRLDLRDGSRTDAVEAFYVGAPESPAAGDYEAVGVATGDAGAGFVPVDRDVSISMSVGAATRSPWNDEHGWAEDGTVWVGVEISDLATNAVWGFDRSEGSHEPMMYWVLDERDLFSLSFGDDDASPVEDRSFTVDADTPFFGRDDSSFDPAEAVIVFEVPEAVTTVVLSVKPSGTLAAEWSDVAGSGSWKSKPESDEFEFSF
ncbi:MAG TPA: hypothetical protein H9881_05950 [Candidatus Stackebrandtia excrementipullorum]|nr:hypothetical protein [Candidatus Stackebrandtia excrementipullorum]